MAPRLRESGGVRQEVVQWREAMRGGPSAPLSAPDPAAVRNRYDLAAALRIVRAMETSAARGAVFAEIKRKNRLYRLVDGLYARAGARVLQPLALFAYMLKCVLSLGPAGADDASAQAVSIANFGNERHSIDRVAALVPGARFLHLRLSRHFFGPGQLRAAGQLVAAAPRLWPLLTRLARVHGFMPAARMASALAFYIRFVTLFADRPALIAAVIASNYSPEAVGLAAAAHRRGRRIVYVNHAPVPANGALVPPVLADCAIFYGDAVRQTYERRSRCIAEVALIGQPWTARPMHWRDDLRTVGIFLTALTRPGVVARLVADIRASHPTVRILIRNHPVALLRNDFSGLAAADGNLIVTLAVPLDDDITACDLIICGNSGVAMNALSGGRPVAYVDALDGLAFDYNGFVESGLVCPVAGWSADLYSRLKTFYFNPRWQSVMRTYDASYGVDATALESAAAAIVAPYLSPQPAPAPAACPDRSIGSPLSRAFG